MRRKIFQHHSSQLVGTSPLRVAILRQVHEEVSEALVILPTFNEKTNLPGLIQAIFRADPRFMCW